MLGLILETALPRPFLFLFSERKIEKFYFLEPGPSLSHSLLPMIASFVSIEDLSFLGVGLGPGSYTGMRVGAITAQTLAYSQNIPLVTFCSLQAFSPKEKTPSLTLLDAKAGGIYCLDNQTNTLYLLAEKELCEKFPTKPSLLSPEITPLKEKLGEESRNWSWEETQVCPERLLSLCLDKWEKKQSDSKAPLPSYYNPSGGIHLL